MLVKQNISLIEMSIISCCRVGGGGLRSRELLEPQRSQEVKFEPRYSWQKRRPHGLEPFSTGACMSGGNWPPGARPVLCWIRNWDVGKKELETKIENIGNKASSRLDADLST